MFCNKCGKQIPDNSTFCNYCGKKLEIIYDNNNSSASKSSIKQKFANIVIFAIGFITMVVIITIIKKIIAG